MSDSDSIAMDGKEVKKFIEVEEKKCFEFEDAITKCGFGKFNYILMFLAASLMSSAFTELAAVNYILPVAQCDLNLETRDKGVLSSMGNVGVILSAPLWGYLSDTRGRKKTLIASMLIAFIASSSSSFVNNFWLMVFLRFIDGFL